MNKVRQFLVGPAPDSKVINLKEVSSIGFESKKTGHKAYKVIINFSYPVSLKNDYKKVVSDYQYFVFQTEEEYNKYVSELNNLINVGWIAPKIENTVRRIINPDKISFISKDLRKNRIIINLATSVSFHNNTDRKTSDFLFIDFETEEEFTSEYNYIIDMLKDTYINGNR